ncbi:phage integrase N-terminal SAM-like domain-containing protein [Methylomicrobium lacus]|uniref:phage integrase N-terminal SAM-like domain-containing protein n=1 Tax=Methylomicrobium lacus TaxID=136992 RepID=UPI0035A9A23B
MQFPSANFFGKPPKLLDQVRDKIRLKHYSIRTEQAYTSRIKRFTLQFAGF